MFRTRIFPYALIAALSLTACGGSDDDDDSPTGPSGDTPTQAEVSDMLVALSAIGSLGIGFNHTDPGLALQSQTFNTTEACPGGGNTSLNGNYSLNTSGQTLTYNYTVTQSYSNCKASGNGKVYTFNGQGLTLTANYGINSSTGTYTYAFHETGNINWAGNSHSGSCPVNINISFSSNSTGQASNIVYSGTFCGQSIN